MHLCPTKKMWNICLEMEKCKLAPITGLKVSSSSMMKPLLNQSRRESTLPYLCKEDTSGVVVSRFICFKYRIVASRNTSLLVTPHVTI